MVGGVFVPGELLFGVGEKVGDFESETLFDVAVDVDGVLGSEDDTRLGCIGGEVRVRESSS